MPETDTAEVAEAVKSLLERDERDWPHLLQSYPENVRREVQSLLGYHEKAAAFLDKPAADVAASLLAGATLSEGELVHHYRIESLIAVGGMGEVYLATDTQLNRRVALKLVQRGFGSQAILRRFQQEEQILATLNHPNIAQLYGSGVAEDGTPFFAMEYVPGMRIDEFCIERALAARARIELFRKVCAAVTYAHQHLVVHRDLKPANIRVSESGEPKLLDFGIAKVLDATTHEALAQTITLERVMTPEYASPEQVRGEPVSTASDVYSLGVILYELLTGSKPYRLVNRTPDALSRAIIEQEPTRPSTAVAKSDKTRVANSVPKYLRGDLDNIVLKAMRKEPSRRYASVAQFSEDLERFLEGRPVAAHKDSFGYRASKFVRRNRAAVAAAAAIVVSLVVGLSVATYEARAAARQARKAERINFFLHRMLSFSNQSVTSVSPVAHKKDVSVNQMLDEITPQLDKELAHEPEARAEVLHTIGSAYASQGLYERAEQNLRAALALQLRVGGEKSIAAANTMLDLGVLSYRQARLDEAARLLTNATSIFEKHRSNANKLALGKDYLGVVELYRGDEKRALALTAEAYALARAAKPQDASALTFIKGDYGGVLIATGDANKGLTLVNEAIADYQRNYGSTRWELGSCLIARGSAAVSKNDFDRAIDDLRQAEQIIRDTLGMDNGYYCSALIHEAYTLAQQNQLDAAEGKAQDALERTSTFAAVPSVAADACWALAVIATKRSDHARAESYYRRTLAGFVQPHGKPTATTAWLQLQISKELLAQQKLGEAEQVAQTAYDESRKLTNANLAKLTRDHLAEVFTKAGKPELASALQRGQ